MWSLASGEARAKTISSPVGSSDLSDFRLAASLEPVGVDDRGRSPPIPTRCAIAAAVSG